MHEYMISWGIRGFQGIAMGDMTASLIWAREQEDLRLLKELDIAFNEVCDDLIYNFCFPSHAYNMMNTFRGLGLEAAEIRVSSSARALYWAPQLSML